MGSKVFYTLRTLSLLWAELNKTFQKAIEYLNETEPRCWQPSTTSSGLCDAGPLYCFQQLFTSGLFSRTIFFVAWWSGMQHAYLLCHREREREREAMETSEEWQLKSGGLLWAPGEVQSCRGQCWRSLLGNAVPCWCWNNNNTHNDNDNTWKRTWSKYKRRLIQNEPHSISLSLLFVRLAWQGIKLNRGVKDCVAMHSNYMWIRKGDKRL